MSWVQSLSRLRRSTRLLIAFSIGLALYIVLRTVKTSLAFSFLYAWIAFAAAVLFFAWLTIFVNETASVGTIASEQDNSPLLTFLFIVSAAFISLFAILALLKSLSGSATAERLTGQHILLSVVAVACSWALIQTLFTLRYAHMYYTYPTHADKADEKPCGGLAFPGNDAPDLLDFAYFAFTLGMAFQVSDVAVTSRRMRRLVLVHALLSFVYNTAIVAFSINILSGIIGK